MKKKYWLDERRNVMRLIWVFTALCAGVLVIDAGFNRKDEFFWEGWFGFYGFFGFIACVVLVLAAKELRRLVMRREDYYDE
jgi:hypothetical protein